MSCTPTSIPPTLISGTVTTGANSIDRITFQSSRILYLTGGGDIVVDGAGVPRLDGAGRLQFRVDVGNYGKTPATITHYAVHFDVLANVKATLKPVSPSEEFRDQLAPRQEKSIVVVPVTQPNADIA
ncbi:MAG: hypothetical protein QOJ15_5872 [Bradyrhizobium sp.]|jgi:hypothetical protein|nr:hypothetical protein [Bradyrhizobium sp.]